MRLQVNSARAQINTVGLDSRSALNGWIAMTSQKRKVQATRTLARAASLALRVVLDGDLRGHAAHGVDAAAVAGLDQQQAVRAHARLRHRYHAPAVIARIRAV